MADRLWWRVPRFLHLMMHQLWAGLVAIGSMAGLVPPAGALELIIEGERSPELPTGHPERLVPDLPPTAQEAELWRQLEFLDRLV
ncbi:hypothetical protein OG689_19910 [Kitasatospora sp. NBC_00240]|uniref:DUF6059 family protein n=1 Tax=Kitasatospora sp. NBC_00240 TaxID=2903567 RepID=UPI00225351CF|nr:DUF6059 family protein [Kitasatospora sp. NBC_00240]MCX5211525.1 hypothetical protein [Kitasatospora sp. NBC_00240]